MNQKDFIDWLEKTEKEFARISEKLPDYDYAKGLMDGAQIAIKSVIRNIELID